MGGMEDHEPWQGPRIITKGELARLEQTAGLLRAAPADGTFFWRDRETSYFGHPYNTTLLNERCIEVPIALNWLYWHELDAKPNGLEVGNVLSHYDVVMPRRVIDLNEVADGVENTDIRDFYEPDSLDWVVSISTLEHVGQTPDGHGDGAGDGTGAIYGLWGSLKPGGRMLVTAPFGQNPRFDVQVLDADNWAIPPTNHSTMVRHSNGTWHEMGGVYWTPGRERGWPNSVWIATWVAP